MKKYFIDKLLFLVIGIGIMLCIPLLCGDIFTVVLEILVAFVWTYLCRGILFLPLDLLRGKKTIHAYFLTQCSMENYEFFKKTYCVEWKFKHEKGHLINLIVPHEVISKDCDTIQIPPKNKQIRITYLPFSRVLLNWDQGTQGDGSSVLD